MNIQLIGVGTPEYGQMKQLRLEVLLRPIGVPESYINPEREAKEHLVAAFGQEEMIGCCVLTPQPEKRLQLRQMAVHKRWQGKGVGAAILAFCEAWATQQGFTEIYMHARDVVIPFYEKSGYGIRGEQFFEVGIPHHVMIKAI
ncbi:GNAT family N-acetyltransferase [Flaviaesturariibacter amylovorans]|uniref:GNAT family N-acetyltransferase n=1 Tax=Flaviaesturariibacter amylovorans TaxID=1084520 RepID=A0ABP8GVI9_9BACT